MIKRLINFGVQTVMFAIGMTVITVFTGYVTAPALTYLFKTGSKHPGITVTICVSLMLFNIIGEHLDEKRRNR